jgi:chromosomal replication initiation ATPase DnaA
MVSGARQLTIPLGHRPQLGRDDFLVSKSNRAALNVIESWPDWQNRLVILFGPPGAGKTHLVNIWAGLSGAMDASKLSDDLHTSPPALYLENVDNGYVDATGLFHLINMAKESGRHLLMTARTPVSDWNIDLPDLTSRLRLATPVHLDAPDEPLLRQVLVKLFADRQLLVEKPVIDYLLKRMERSLAAARDLVEAMDHVALAENKKITRGLAARLIEQRNKMPIETGP